MPRLRVGLLFGGRSAEHEVSCQSARHVAAAMDPDRYEVIPIGISREGKWVLPDESSRALEGNPLKIPSEAFAAEGRPVALVPDPARQELIAADPQYGLPQVKLDVVFPVLHGPFGEDGTVQGLLELAGIPYVGSGVLGSANGMDKEKMKILFAAAGLPIGDYLAIRAHQWANDKDRLLDESAWLGFPVFTKPANLGSSVGISRCTDLKSLQAGIELAFSYDRKVVVEQGISGREIECGILGNESPIASVCGEVLAAGEFYDYESKYIDADSRAIVPAAVPEPVAEIVRSYSLRAFQAIDAAGMARVDFFYEEGGRGVVANEINTIPGFTTISMFPMLWKSSGLTYSDLIDRLIALGLDRHSRR
ncbi:MAG: D-alanine--D-alanine ligase family protein [Actinomycetota bacterium]